MPAWALSSTNYQIQEDFLGTSGSSVDGSSTHYQAQDTGGATAVGDGSATTYQTKSGVPTPSEPNLSLVINTSSVNLGTLSNATTATGTATFSVLNYTSFGYIVQVLGNTPSNGSHNLTALSSPTASSAGSEQFGINLVANTGFGADPAQVPSSSFSYGAAGTGYNTANTFKYVSGNTIAAATKSSGQTNYTISYIANISIATPNGNYAGTQTIVCTGTY